MNSWKIFVPATTANLGSGFDCLGLALSLYDQFTFFPVEGSVKSTPLYGSKEESPYAPKGNLVIDSYWAYGKREGVKLPAMKVKIGGDIPSTRGLGSSAACSVAGVLAAALYSGAFGSFQDLEKKLDSSGFYYPMQEKGEALDAIVEAAVFMEGHPDNAIPALFGGLNQSSCQGKRTLYSHLPLSQDLRFLLLIPDFMVSTEEARAILPKEIDRVKACQNIGYQNSGTTHRCQVQPNTVHSRPPSGRRYRYDDIQRQERIFPGQERPCFCQFRSCRRNQPCSGKSTVCSSRSHARAPGYHRRQYFRP